MYISILIPIYNGIEFIEESISSVKRQTYENWEVIIGVNGHSKDSEIYLEAKKYESDKIKVYDFYTTKGKSNTLNKMVNLTKYDRIALLDVDDIWLDNKLEKQVEILEKEDYDVIGTQCQYFGESNKKPNINFGLINNSVFEKTNMIINSSSIIKKELCYWDPEYESVEDYELWVRLSKQNKKFYNISHVLIKHRIHKKSAFNSGNNQDELIYKIKVTYYPKRVTLVSAFYIFKSKFPVSKYKEWIKNFMRIKSNKVIFTNKETLPHIKEFDVHKDTIYVLLEISEFLTSKYDKEWNKNLEIDHEKYHNINLYKIWAEKSEFLKKAIQLNHYSSYHYVWCDIGCFRDIKRLKEFSNWPKYKKIKDKVIFLQIKPFTPKEKQNIQNIDNRFKNVVRIGGGIISGRKDKLLEWHKKYYNTLQQFFEKGIFAGKDQNVYAFTILQNPELVQIITAPNGYKHDVWFYLEDYLN